MRVMVLVKATIDSESGIMPSSELFESMGKYNEELMEAGVLQAGEGLKPSSEGKRVAFDGDSRVVSDGPFAATNELVAGFWLWEVKDMDEAPTRCRDRARSRSARSMTSPTLKTPFRRKWSSLKGICGRSYPAPDRSSSSSFRNHISRLSLIMSTISSVVTPMSTPLTSSGDFPSV